MSVSDNGLKLVGLMRNKKNEEDEKMHEERRERRRTEKMINAGLVN